MNEKESVGSRQYLCVVRPLAYSTLADLVHHVRQSLSLSDLALAVNLFSKNVHDESLPCSIQTMSCKLLLNLVECIRAKSEAENGNVSGGLVLVCKSASWLESVLASELIR